jgi:anti-sigma B factor antagonist
MAFAVQQDSDERTFRLVGELDLATADELIHRLDPAVRDGGDLLLELGALRFMDSSGIRALIKVCQELGDRGRVVLRSPTGEVAKVLQLVRADTFPNLIIDSDGDQPVMQPQEA